jgi:hypothetical protein
MVSTNDIRLFSEQTMSMFVDEKTIEKRSICPIGIIDMPTVLLIDCSLNMAERFPFVVKQGEHVAATMTIEKRSLVAKIIESMMINTSSPTKLESIALVRCRWIVDEIRRRIFLRLI